MSRIVVPAEIYSRVSGYFRPLTQWNKGKQDEFSQRKGLLFSSDPEKFVKGTPLHFAENCKTD